MDALHLKRLSYWPERGHKGDVGNDVGHAFCLTRAASRPTVVRDSALSGFRRKSGLGYQTDFKAEVIDRQLRTAKFVCP
jgi:hypothetical protein